MARKRDVDVWILDTRRPAPQQSIEIVTAQWSVNARKFWQPNADIHELDDCICIFVELSGVRIEDIQVTYADSNHTLLIKGDRSPKFERERHVGIYQMEIMYGEFERELTLPQVVIDSGNIEASFKDGILKIRVPKRTQ